MTRVRPIPLSLTNAHDLTKWRWRLWLIGRILVPRRYRRLYEGDLHIPGQLWFEDRRVLDETVRLAVPRRCFEVGTWMGGGSTLVIARALSEIGAGQLHTIESHLPSFERAVSSYAEHVAELLPYVEFHSGDYRDTFPEMIEGLGGVDFFVLDGAEDANETMEQFRFFDSRSHEGTVLFAHDWNTEKCRLLRAHLDGSDTWQVVRVVGPPKSVGLAVARRGSEGRAASRVPGGVE